MLVRMTNDRLMDVVFPARDQALSKVLSALSEPDAGRSADNLITNEDSFARVADELSRVAPSGGVYLGVGPDQNFSLIAHARPRLAFVLDFRRRNALLHLVHKALFALANDRESYLTKLLARRPVHRLDNPSADQLVAAFEGVEMDRTRLDSTIAEVAETLRPLGLVLDSEWPELATIQAKLAGPGLNARFLALPMYPNFARLILSKDRLDRPAHFLAREPWYQTIRAAQIGDRVLPLVGDFAGPTALPALADWLRHRRLAVSVFYISDVEFFLLRSGRFADYVANLRKLPWLEGAFLIRTSTREIPHPERSPGDSSTTILRPVAKFLEDVEAGRIKTVDDLFS
jgi:SAM-dependent methyltransferase